MLSPSGLIALYLTVNCTEISRVGNEIPSILDIRVLHVETILCQYKMGPAS